MKPIVKFVSEQGLENLKTYKYAGVDNSLCGKLFLNAFWNWAINFVPLWIAPNLVTLFGGVCMASATALCAFYAPTFTEAPPGWVLVLSAVLIWLYQTADNLDGKQARRTRSGSPLGELFDHGLDSLVMGLICGVVCVAFRGGPFMSAIGSVITMIPFYLSHWEEYHCGMLIMGELTGPTELQNIVILMLLTSAALPNDFWLMKLPFCGFALNQAFLWLLILGVFGIAANYALSVVKLTRTGGKGVMNKFYNVSQAMGQPLIYSCFVALTLIWIIWTPSTVAIYPHVYVFATTLSFAYMTQRLIVQRICKEPFHAPLIPLLPVVFAALNSVAGSPIPEMVVLVIVLICSFAIEAVFVFSIINQLATFLHIRPFVIPYPPPTTP